MKQYYKLKRDKNETPQTDHWMCVKCCDYGYDYSIGYGDTKEEAEANLKEVGLNAYGTYEHNDGHLIVKLLNRLSSWKYEGEK